MEKLDPETRKRFEAGEINVDDLKGMGLIPQEFDVDASYGDIYGSEEGEAENGDPDEEGGNKRQKKDDEGEKKEE